MFALALRILSLIACLAGDAMASILFRTIGTHTTERVTAKIADYSIELNIAAKLKMAAKTRQNAKHCRNSSTSMKSKFTNATGANHYEPA